MLTPTTLLFLIACGDRDGATCGEGTTLVDGECVPLETGTDGGGGDGGTDGELVRRLVVGWYHSCLIGDDSKLDCWGPSGSDPVSFGIVADAPTSEVIGAAISLNAACAVLATGYISCWGEDSYIKTGVTTEKSTKVGVGGSYACALGEDQQIRCWGRDQFGYGTTDPPAGTFTDLHVSYAMACGLDTGGAIQCWGNSQNGETSPPAEIFGRVHQLALAEYAGCALLTDGSLRCWGGRKSSSTADWGEHMPPLGNDFVAIRRGVSHLCAIRSDGTAACWGNNYAGQSAQVPLDPVVDVGAGIGFSCVLYADDEVECWGENSKGQTEGP